MGKEYYYEDRIEIGRIDNDCNRMRASLDNIRVEWVKAGLTLGLSIEDVKFVLRTHGTYGQFTKNQITEYVATRTINEDERLKSLNLKNEELLKIVNVPNVDGLTTAFNNLKVVDGCSVPLGFFALSTDSVEVDEASVEALKSEYRYSAETKEHKTRLEAVQKLCDALNEVSKLRNDQGFSPEHWGMPDRLCFYREGDGFQPEPAFINSGIVIHYAGSNPVPAQKRQEETEFNWGEIIKDEE
jgi:hypothetical protein